MTTTLAACIVFPRLLVQLATHHIGLPAPLAVVADTAPHAPILECCDRAAAHGIAPGMPAFIAHQRCARLTTLPLATSVVDAARMTIDVLLRQQGDQLAERGRGTWQLRVVALGPHYQHAPAVARDLLHRLGMDTGLAATLAFAPTHTVAHIASHAAADHGSTSMIILPGEEAAWLAPLPLSYVPGIGAKTEARLTQFGITTIGAFAALPTATVVQLLGTRGRMLHALAHGEDIPTPSTTNAHAPLESTWIYTPHACADGAELLRHTHRLTERVGRHLRLHALAAGGVTVAVQWADGRAQQRTERLAPPADLDGDLAVGSRAALRAALATRRVAVRSLTVRLDKLGPPQALLFDHDRRAVERQHALDQIKRRHGTDAIVWASLLPSPIH